MSKIFINGKEIPKPEGVEFCFTRDESRQITLGQPKTITVDDKEIELPKGTTIVISDE